MTTNDELLLMEMLYMNSQCYAQGHGCSVVWDIDNTEPHYIKTAFVPSFNLQQMKANEITGTPVFNMLYLHTAEKEDVINNLRSFMSLYAEWIKEQRLLGSSEKYATYSDAATKALDTCEGILNRIIHSIDLLDEDNGFAWIAFKYANEAMYLQRCKTIEKKDGAEAINPEKINWYPFQLAFILLEIASFVEPDGEDRKLVDLLWFPTGGGKTEAYLGIAAFEIFYRRLSNP